MICDGVTRNSSRMDTVCASRLGNNKADDSTAICFVMACQNDEDPGNTLDLLLAVVCQRFGSGFELRPKQREALEYIWEWDVIRKRDLLVSLPTGAGKSLIFQVLPELLAIKENREDENSVVLVLCPLNLIQSDQLLRLRTIGITACRIDVNGTAHTIPTGPLPHGLQAETVVALKDLDDVADGRFRIVFGHPESLFRAPEGKALLQKDGFRSRVTAVCVDECHKVDEWKGKFRTAFADLDSLVAFFPTVPIIAMSGTLTTQQLRDIPRHLCMRGPVSLVSANPDRSNIYLARKHRQPNIDVRSAYEEVFQHECQRLLHEAMHYPVTLLYLPYEQIAAAMAYITKLFNHPDVDIYDARVMYAAVYSRLDLETITVVTSELRKPTEFPSRIRLIFCTSSIGMGFDSPQIMNIIHGKPPYLMSDYFQQVGRAGRCGQQATATLWCNKSDVSSHDVCDSMKLYCRSEDQCLRSIILSVFGFSKEGSGSGRCCTVCSSRSQELDLGGLIIS